MKIGRNLRRATDDLLMVRCEIFREALSARMDSELGPVSEEDVDAHVATCSACRAWRDRNAALRRSLLLCVAPPVPDLTDTILANTPSPAPEKWGLRVALALVAIAQSALALTQLLGMDTGMHAGHGGFTMSHLLNESAAWNLAVGVGLLWAALRPQAAAGQLPVIAGFVLVLTIVSADDLAAGNVTAGRLESHGFVVLGLALLYAVHRRHRDRLEPGPVTGDILMTDNHISLRDRNPRPTAAAVDGTGRTTRPAGRHHAA
jgi:predicted anti-sigma-YlaC factor YlaD